MPSNLIRTITVSLFLTLLLTGALLSQRKVLWIDEIYTQSRSIDTHSYRDILTLNFIEGNKTPLFYIIQKVQSDSFSFKLPLNNAEIPHKMRDKKAQFIMRLSSNICMSLGICAIFYFFARHFSLWTAFYALLISLTSPMVLLYWAEARPYALWFLLTALQLCLLWTMVITEKATDKQKGGMSLIHLLLILTSTGSLFQVAIASFMLWRGKYCRLRELGWIFLIPILLGIFYYLAAPLYSFKTYFLWINLTDAVMPERLLVYILYAVICWKNPKNSFFLKTFLLFLTSALFILITHLNTPNSQFGFFSRYLIYLVPADIMLMSMASRDLIQSSRKNRLLFINTMVLFTGLLILRGLMTYRHLLASGTYLNTPG